MELERSFGGEAANLVKSAGNSAATLIELITRHFPGKSSITLILYLVALVLTSPRVPTRICPAILQREKTKIEDTI